MLPTFVITLREGVEAALIIGIIAAFLRQEGRADGLRQMWLGVGVAVLLCILVAVGLRVAGDELPARQAEGLAAAVALVAVGFVTYMIVWMGRHARELRGRLQREVAGALARGSLAALVAMAFFAVLREGFETTVFLLAIFEDASDPAAAGAGGILGLLAAVLLGWGLYRGGVRIDLARFFKLTGVVLVLVAAGLVAGALRSAAEAGWLTAGQAQALDLTWLVQPGSVVGALLTGLFGVEAEPTVIEVVGWLAYAVPMLVFVLAPRALAPRLRGSLAGGAVAVAPVALLVGVLAGGTEGGASADAAPGARRVSVAVSSAGCEPARLRLRSGPTIFTVTSRESSRVTEFELLDGDRVLAEAENLAAGVQASFSLILQPGRYQTRCPGGSRSATGELLVTGREVRVRTKPAGRQRR